MTVEQNSVELAWELLMEPAYEDLQRCIYTNDEEDHKEGSNDQNHNPDHVQHQENQNKHRFALTDANDQADAEIESFVIYVSCLFAIRIEQQINHLLRKVFNTLCIWLDWMF